VAYSYCKSVEFHLSLDRKHHRIGRVISFFSSRRNWDSPNPSPAGESATRGSRVRGTLAGERGVGRLPIPTRGHTLFIYTYFVGSTKEDTKCLSYMTVFHL
jgi:hypothetical protein